MGGSGKKQQQAASAAASSDLNDRFDELLDRARPILHERDINRALEFDDKREAFNFLSENVVNEERRRAASAQQEQVLEGQRKDKAERDALEAAKKKAQGSITTATQRNIVKGGGLPRRGALATKSGSTFSTTLG